jgi:uncharacterized membrane protein YdbT with pleckstrin-like domain
LIFSSGLISKDKFIKTGFLVAIPTLLMILLVVWILSIP